MTDELIKVENLRRLDVQPGDRFVLLYPHEISMVQVDAIQAEWRRFIGDKTTKLMIIPMGAEIGVIRQESDALV